MEIDSRLSILNQTAQSLKTSNDTTLKTNGSVFEDFYKAAINLYEDTNQMQLTADNLQMDYITGKTDDMLSVVMAQEKAYTSLSFTTQVTNKIIEAYREIMRMQM